VVNYELPVAEAASGALQPSGETYTHRIGRTGRFGRKGIALTLVYDGESRAALDAIVQQTHHSVIEAQDLDDVIDRAEAHLKS
jgi:superfamily II DNA/RNA helicase